MEWDGSSDDRKQLPAGIYICHLEAKTIDSKISKDVKIILIK